MDAFPVRTPRPGIPSRRPPGALAAVVLAAALGACAEPEGAAEKADAAEASLQLEIYVLSGDRAAQTLEEAAQLVADEPAVFTMAAIWPDRALEGDLTAFVEIAQADVPRFVAWTERHVGRQVLISYDGTLLSMPFISSPLPGELVVTFDGLDPPPSTLADTPLAPAWRRLRAAEPSASCAADRPRVEVRPVLAPDAEGTRVEDELYGPLVLGDAVEPRVRGARESVDALGYAMVFLELCAEDAALVRAAAERSPERTLAVLRDGALLSIGRLAPDRPAPEGLGVFGAEGDIDADLAAELLRAYGEDRAPR